MVLKDLLKKTDKEERDLLVSLDIGTEAVKALIAEVRNDAIEVIGVVASSKNWVICILEQSLTYLA